MIERVLTVRQPWADLLVAGVKDVENRTWPVPSTLPQWGECDEHARTPPSAVEHDERGFDVHWPGDPDSWYGGIEHFCTVTLDGPFPFRLWVHAAKKAEPEATEAWEALARARGARSWMEGMATVMFETLERCGVLLGSVTVTGCHRPEDCVQLATKPCPCLCHAGHDARHVSPCCEGGREPDPFADPVMCSTWAEPGVWHWTVRDPEPLDEPIPLRGRQGLWQLPAEVSA